MVKVVGEKETIIGSSMSIKQNSRPVEDLQRRQRLHGRRKYWKLDSRLQWLDSSC